MSWNVFGSSKKKLIDLYFYKDIGGYFKYVNFKCYYFIIFMNWKVMGKEVYSGYVGYKIG